MSFHDAYVSAASWVTAVGVPGALIYFGRKLGRRLLRTGNERREDAAADVESATVQDRIETSSVTAVEARVVAMDRAFTIERGSLNRTIEFLQRDNEDLRTQVDDKDRRLREALSKIDELQAQLTELADQIRAEVLNNTDAGSPVD